MTKTSHQIQDAVPGHWIEQMLPPRWLPYGQLMRLDRPVGWWLLLLPCWLGLLLGQLANGGGLPPFGLALLFWLGAVIMRGAGCTLNDLADRKFDAQVARTRNRPLPSGRVSVRQAVIFLGAQCLLGLLILLQFNGLTILLGFASLAIVAIYPFMKRFTYWPQLVLGFAFNWGALLGFTAVTDSLTFSPFLLYVAGICWTLGYDTIYAHQDKEDDILIGVKSTALKLGAYTRYWLVGFYSVTIILLVTALLTVQAGWISYLGVVCAGLQGGAQIYRFKADDAASCLQLFKSNRTFGLILVFFIFMDCVTR